MRGTAVAIVAGLSLSLAVGCANVPEISFDARDDFSHYRTWDWLPGTARIIDAPTENLVGLDRDLARIVELELERQGLERVRGGADLRVGAVLNVRREVKTVFETGAIEFLPSHHASPSFQVQSTVQRDEVQERFRLVVFATDPRLGRVVWTGALEDRSRERFASYLERTVASILGQFPPAGRGSPSPGRDPDLKGPTKFTTSSPPSEPDA